MSKSGYSRKYDEWRKADDIVDLNDSDNLDEETVSLTGNLWYVITI